MPPSARNHTSPPRRSFMTKQRRPVKLSRAKAPAAQSSAHSSVREPMPQPHVSVPDPVPRRSTYVEAVALYERGLDALQRHDYPDAVGLFESVLRQYPEEKEFHEQVDLYLNICNPKGVLPHP